jgi:mRNA interferase RelE/StbE
MIFYENEINKSVSKGDLPKEVFKLFHHAFQSLDLTKDLNLFDIKKMKGNHEKNYFRLRKGKYRALFYMENNDFYVIYIGKRDEVYDLWQ